MISRRSFLKHLGRGAAIAHLAPAIVQVPTKTAPPVVFTPRVEKVLPDPISLDHTRYKLMVWGEKFAIEWNKRAVMKDGKRTFEVVAQRTTQDPECGITFSYVAVGGQVARD